MVDRLRELNFSITNNLAVMRNSIPLKATAISSINVSTLLTSISGLFVGDCNHLTVGRRQLSEAEKAAFLPAPVLRFGSYDIAGNFYSSTNPSQTYPFYFVGLALRTGPQAIIDFVIAHCKLPDGTAPDGVYLGAIQRRA